MQFDNIEYRRRIYSVGAYYDLLADAIVHFSDIRGAHKGERVSKAFSERIMLAVTEVNGCRYCSYYHANLSLNEGMSEAEIHGMLTGDLSNAPEEESVALLFAQHYAETEGHPNEEACRRLLATYGPERASDILASIRVIMVGNVSGIMLEALKNRLTGKPNPESSLGRELGIVFGTVGFIPVIAVRRLFGKDVAKSGPTPGKQT
jgi:AhpD family alkylhydroperoxidase